MHQRLLVAVVLLVTVASIASAGTKVTLDEDGVLSIDGKKTFVFSFSLPPPPDGKTPEGKDAFAELRDAGVNFMRIRPTTGSDDYTEKGIRSIKPWLDAAAGAGMHCWVTLRPLPTIDPNTPQNEREIRLALAPGKDHAVRAA